MKRFVIGIGIGAVAGIINILPMLFAKNIGFTIYLSTFITWLIIGFFIVSSSLRLNGTLKGILISVLISLPSLIFTFASTLYGAIWNIAWVLILGAVTGSVLDKLAVRK
ncbi:hypothetical protein [Ethanoligenens sp.]|uniref:hypothetical protein n=1 Tax=Ethanoligenens sp. TaxID=2099655 RepID=UPI0039E9038D